MKKVAFYLDNRSISSVDCKNILEANPGIGGTEYLILLVSYLLMLRDNDIQVKVYTHKEGLFPIGFNYEVISDFEKAVSRAEEQGCDYIVFRHDASLITTGILDRILGSIKMIVWDHVFVCYWELDYYASHPNIYKIINVGREMNDLHRDHKAFLKSSYIYNCVNLDVVEDKVASYPFEERKPIVTYIGSIVPFKGLHLLAEAWPMILKDIPDAELYIIGSGKLYNRNAKMGKYGIAEEGYENLLMKYLCKDGKLLPSVHFLGVLGKEKEEVLLKTKVGVPNPSGITETFCLSAVEMQMYGARIATISYPGYLDTVKNGILYSKRKDLYKSVVKLLNSNHTNYSDTMEYFHVNFSYETVVKRWEELFHNGDLKKDKKVINWGYRLKWLKEIVGKSKKIFPLLDKVLPNVERILLFIERKLKGNITYLDS